ncbi:hypothetical protein [Gaiella sp.]|uniref:hypothetical protein n=1 Tax=Gaiella sp. TaxID=2663207 RepID=UPI0039837CA3
MRLTWPLGEDDNGGQWSHRVVDLVDGLIHGHNQQVIISRRGRVLEATTMIVTQHCERRASVHRPGNRVFTGLLLAIPAGRTIATRRIRFAAETSAPQHLMLDASPNLWRELGCSHRAVQAARSSFCTRSPGRVATLIASLGRLRRSAANHLFACATSGAVVPSDGRR